ETWEKWRNETANPAIAEAERVAAAARLEAARFKEEAKIARDYGLLPEDKGEKTPAPPSVSNPTLDKFDPKAHNLLTQDEFKDGVARFAELEGDAIARAQDLADRYRELMGKPLTQYVGDSGKRGMVALREEAKVAKLPVDDYVARKFDFAKKEED